MISSSIRQQTSSSVWSSIGETLWAVLISTVKDILDIHLTVSLESTLATSQGTPLTIILKKQLRKAFNRTRGILAVRKIKFIFQQKGSKLQYANLCWNAIFTYVTSIQERLGSFYDSMPNTELIPTTSTSP